MYSIRSLSLFGASLALVAGCQSFKKQNRVSRQDEAGSTHVAVLSVVPWESYAESVQPTFKLTPDEALSQAIPNTVAIEEKLINGFLAKVKVALPQSSSSSVETLSRGTGQKPTTTNNATNTTGPGDLSSASFGPSPIDGKSASELPPGTSVLASTLGTDPILKYLVANALFQEVQLLNQQIKNAAIDSKNYDAYLVRFQFSVMPRMRDEPYDAYANVSFFTGDFDSDGPATPPEMIANVFKNVPATDASSTNVRAAIVALIRQNYACCPSLVEEFETRLKELPYLKSGGEEKARDQKLADQIIGRRCEGKRGKTPIILPLLVTDDIQAALHSRSTEQIIQLGLALSGMISGVGLGADIQSASDKLRTTLGRDFNSTFTVARLSDNTLRVRFGAIQQAAGTYAMIPQTHNVSAVVLVPKLEVPQNQTMRLVSKTTMLDADKGTVLLPRDSSAVQASIQRVLNEYGYKGILSEDGQRKLFGYLDKNDYPAFQQYVEDELKSITMPEALWLDLASLKNGSQYNSARFVVPAITIPSIALPTQTPTLLDDGKAATVTALQGGKGLKANRLRGALQLSGKAANGDTLTPLTLLANTIEVLDGGRAIQLSFPSLTGLKLASDGKLQPRSDAVLQLFRLNENGEDSLIQANCVYAAKPSNEPAFSMSVSSKVINSTEGKGTVIITFSKVKAKVKLSFDGADILVPATLPTGVSNEPDGLSVEKDCVLSLELQNLNPIANVVITAKDPAGASIQVVRPVMELNKKK
jgi:hypothetical protein